MINKNELRLGNLVMDIVSGEWMVVDEIGENVGATVINRDKYPLNPGWEMGPIPITAEILELSGFKNSLTGTCRGLVTSDGKDRFSIFYDGRFKVGTEDLSIKILFLHQLQNLYFALTGTEQTINIIDES